MPKAELKRKIPCPWCERGAVLESDDAKGSISVNTMWRYIKNELGTNEFSSHSFRHAVATFYIANGVDIVTTQTIMGHSQPSTTMNIYAHAVPKNIKNAGKIFTEKVLMRTNM